MEFIKEILKLFNELFIMGLSFEPFIYLFVCVCLILMIVCLIQAFLKGSYTKK